jgi:hypothetical protein
MTDVKTPLPLFDVDPTDSPESLDEKLTLPLEMRLPCASLTVAVAVVVELPLATIDVGWRLKDSDFAGPTVSVSFARSATAGFTDPSFAVIVFVPADVELVSVAVQVSSPLLAVVLVGVLKWIPPSSAENAIEVVFAGFVTVAVAVLVETPSATMLFGFS